MRRWREELSLWRLRVDVFMWKLCLDPAPGTATLIWKVHVLRQSIDFLPLTKERFL